MCDCGGCDSGACGGAASGAEGIVAYWACNDAVAFSRQVAARSKHVRRVSMSDVQTCGR